jgi:DNA replication and repair protein RecF
MVLEQLSIVNYKNIAESTLRFSPKINCFVGHNGAGKTNVLDAIYFLSFCHSATTVQDQLVLRHEEEFFVIEGEYSPLQPPPTGGGSTSSPSLQISPTGGGSPTSPSMKIFCGMKRGTKKHFKRDGKEYKRLSEHIGLIPIVMVSPADNLLIEGGSEERRRLMDQVIAQIDRRYIEALNRYNKALQQRNALLRDEDHEPDPALMDVLEEEMARQGEFVSSSRSQLVEQLTPLFQQFYQRIAEGHEQVALSYVSHCQRGPLLDVIRRDRLKDRAVGYSLHGIHRDDLDILLNGHPMRREGSQGQLKTFVIALKLAQYELLRQHFHDDQQPLLLLDDIFDKLDAHRVEHIIQLVASQQFGQIFITDTNRDHLDQILSHGDFDYRLFNVSNGQIE